MSVLSRDAVLRAGSSFAPEMILHLNLSEQRLAEGAELAKCSNLVSLNISHNALSDIAWAAALSSIRVLNLSFNNIMTLSPLLGLESLQELYLEGNNVCSVDHVRGLSVLASLRVLRLRQLDGEHANPVCADAMYDSECAKLTSLYVLDGHRVKSSLAAFKLAPACAPLPPLLVPPATARPTQYPSVDDMLSPLRARVDRFAAAATNYRVKSAS